MTPWELRGVVFALRSNGDTLRAIGQAIGRSADRVRIIDKLTMRRIEIAADRAFPLPPEIVDWTRYRQPIWLPGVGYARHSF